MKKFFLLPLLSVALLAQAQIYYLMPTATENAPVANIFDVLPWEGDCTEANAEVSPERRAYDWFKTEIAGGQDRYITVKDIADGVLDTANIHTLWINIDRINFDLNTGLDALFTGAVHMKLKDFVTRGGNLYLSKQALRLVCQIGRCSWWPEYKSAGYESKEDSWYMVYNFDCDGNVDNHSAYRFAENKENFQVDWATRFPLTSGDGEYRRTDNNNGWGWWDQYDAGKGALNRPGITLNERRAEFEAGQNCRILGGWGHTRYIDYAGMVEFFPDTVGADYYAGTVMVMGLAAYQWGPQNLSEYNVKNLTKGILTYLEGNAYWLEGEAPHDGEVGDTILCTPLSTFEGYHIDLVSTNTEVADFVEGTNRLALKTAGTTKVQAIYTGDGVQSCKTQIVLEQEITVTGGTTALPMNRAEKVVKCVENGQVVVIKNGVRYNVLGAQL